MIFDIESKAIPREGVIIDHKMVSSETEELMNIDIEDKIIETMRELMRGIEILESSS